MRPGLPFQINRCVSTNKQENTKSRPVAHRNPDNLSLLTFEKLSFLKTDKVEARLLSVKTMNTIYFETDLSPQEI